MLREVKDCGWARRWTLFGRRYDFAAGKHQTSRGVSQSQHDMWAGQQHVTAVAVMADEERTYWWCMDRFWVESEGLDAADVHALVYEREARKQRKLKHAHATVAATSSAVRRAPIPRDIRHMVFERDGGRCVECDADFDIQFDHIIPVAMGGANTVENLQLLCAPCNKSKGATLG
ncbi:MAG TPA: HNH endonuclease [Baekduia sp.]|nr:HNH endonuclease [Baekduia sp.]